MHLGCPLTATVAKNFLNYFSNKAKQKGTQRQIVSVCVCVKEETSNPGYTGYKEIERTSAWATQGVHGQVGQLGKTL